MSDRNDGEWDWTDQTTQLPKKKSWKDRIVLVAGLCLLLVVIGVIGIFIRAAYAALDAEKTMQTCRRVARLVEQFVSENRRWPASWKELEATKLPTEDQQKDFTSFIGPWPESVEEVKRRVHIDFQPDLKEIAHQDRYAFEAIKPIGHHFEYRGYGDVDGLQETLRSRVPGLNK
jgi:hypothetical protein